MNRNLVYGSQADANPAHSDVGTTLAAYDYRAFGEMIELTPPPTGKVTENFTGKEHDDEIALDYFGARYLDPMLGMWVSVDPKRQFASPYLYAGNGVNPVNGTDPDGKGWILNTYLYGGEIYIKGDLKYVNDGSNDIHFKLPGGFETRFASPPIGSYFFSVNLNDVKFDPNMIHYIRKMRNEIKESETPVIDYLKWRSGGNFDFKDRFYGDKVYTIGILDGTIMTARDVGNTLWGERMKERNWSWTMTNFISDLISEKLLVIFGCQEDYESKKMQDWGYHKRK